MEWLVDFRKEDCCRAVVVMGIRPMIMSIGDMRCPRRAGWGKSVAVGGYCDGAPSQQLEPWPVIPWLAAFASSPVGQVACHVPRWGSGRSEVRSQTTYLQKPTGGMWPGEHGPKRAKRAGLARPRDA